MKAVVRDRYGSPDVLRLEDVEKPTPAGDKVLVKIQAASANPLDWRMLRADPFLLRLMGAGLFRPKDKILGSDIAGRIEAVGESVTRFKPGDQVFGSIATGGFAEYACGAEDRFAIKPAGLSFEEAATIPIAGVTALQGLRDIGSIQSGDKVLINGATGGVGSFAVQIAKSFGAEVTGVCSAKNSELARSLGADRVIDYTQEDFTTLGQHYDLILDSAAYHSISSCKRALSPDGVYVLVGGSMALYFRLVILGPWFSMTGKKKMVAMIARIAREDLDVMKELIESGKVAPVIDRRYSLDEAPEALRYLEKGHARGKVVITI